MKFSVNIKEIREHLDILRREKDVVQSLIACLNKMMDENAAAMLCDPVLIHRLLKSAQNELTNIQRRIGFLESTAEEFQLLIHSTDTIFTDARDLASIYGAD